MKRHELNSEAGCSEELHPFLHMFILHTDKCVNNDIFCRIFMLRASHSTINYAISLI